MPCTVTWNGLPLPDEDWSYDGEAQVVRVRFEGRRGLLRVQARCR